ncbi:cyclin-dependent kinases regulatory subunit [Sporobolomyces salmoneus]|uniref:cyclin-dependent kinases regulatory subunit n=1 Tax=Sporobolomyces salmoneus TaxID=183962 RepID=UPI003172669D
MSKALSSKELEQKRKDIERWQDEIYYSPRYSDDDYEYRHVIVPKALVKWLPKGRLAEEDEWRGLGIRQSPGWETYLSHGPEEHILLFRRDKD